MFLRDLQLISGWIVICEISHELYIFNVFLTGARLKNLILYNIMG